MTSFPIVALAALLSAGCGSSSSQPLGGLGAACYADHLCNADLTCLAGICVPSDGGVVPTDAAGDHPVPVDATGAAGSGGAGGGGAGGGGAGGTTDGAAGSDGAAPDGASDAHPTDAGSDAAPADGGASDASSDGGDDATTAG